MRIAFLCQSYPPMVSGIAMAVRRMAEGLAARGHNLLVLTASDRNEPYTVETGSLRVDRLASLPNPTRVGQRWVFWSRADVARRLDEFQPDVLHLHDPFLAGFSIPSLAREKGIPLAITAHALPWYVSSQAPDLPGLRHGIEIALWAFAQEVLAQCDAVVAPSRPAAEVIEQNVGRSPVVISNGVDLRLFHPGPVGPEARRRLAKAYAFDPDLPILLHVGRIDVEKRVEVVVQAAAHAMQRAEAQLVIVGDGKQRRSIVHLARELGLGDRAHFIGFVAPEDDLPELYRMASLFAVACELETEGLVVLEAAASGLPLLAVRATVMPALVEASGAGLLVDPGDARAMGEKMVELLSNPDRAREMGAAARTMAGRHDLEDTLAAHERLYGSLLARPRLPSEMQVGAG
ncbi:MAG TPA: glycosyltransferase [Anaerolineales bacterium]|nr:glycosyltransferase [Anaerolineales bacterium]